MTDILCRGRVHVISEQVAAVVEIDKNTTGIVLKSGVVLNVDMSYQDTMLSLR